MGSKEIISFLVSMLLGIVIVLDVAVIPGIRTYNPPGAAAAETGEITYPAKTTGSTAEGDVEIQLTPSTSGNRLIVKVVMDTHSVDLGQFDLTKIATLEYGGKKISPIEAKKPGGHHSYGKIIFDVEEGLRSFKIKIMGIPKIRERVYDWDLK